MTKLNADEVTEVVEIFDKDPLKIARDPEARKKTIAFLRNVRENVAEAEALGKKPSKKVAREGVKKAEEVQPIDPLEALATST